MAPPFDPYHKWFGIPPDEQPPNHYRLLGISLYEEDTDVIEAAAAQRVTFLQAITEGPHLAIAQELLNKISRVRLVLLNVEQRGEYDTSLREAEHGLGFVAADIKPAARRRGAIREVALQPKKNLRTKKESRVLGFAIGLAAIAILAIGFWYFGRNHAPRIDVHVLSVSENPPPGAYRVLASDEDGDLLNYRIVGGTDEKQLSIDPASGQITFHQSPDFENPHDEDQDGVFEIEVLVTDGLGSTDQQMLTIRVKDLDEAPIFGSPPFKQTSPLNEDAMVASEVGTLSVVDPEGEQMTHSILGSHDRDGDGREPFRLVGVMLTVHDPGDLDYESGDSFELNVQATDGIYRKAKKIKIALENSNEPPVIDAEKPFQFEVRAGGQLGRIVARDPEGDQIQYEFVGTGIRSWFEPIQEDGLLRIREGRVDLPAKISIRAVDGAGLKSSSVDIPLPTWIGANKIWRWRQKEGDLWQCSLQFSADEQHTDMEVFFWEEGTHEQGPFSLQWDENMWRGVARLKGGKDYAYKFHTNSQGVDEEYLLDLDVAATKSDDGHENHWLRGLPQ